MQINGNAALLTRPGVWLLGARSGVKLRDGVGFKAPVVELSTEVPKWFRRLSAAKFLTNPEVIVLPDMAPPEGAEMSARERRELLRLEMAKLDAAVEAEDAADEAEEDEEPAPKPEPKPRAAKPASAGKPKPPAEAPKAEVEAEGKAGDTKLDPRARLEAEMGGAAKA